MKIKYSKNSLNTVIGVFRYYIYIFYLRDSLQMTYLKKVLEKHIYIIINCSIV
jgi:hypothetical protein